jgi:hypothetical protein
MLINHHTHIFPLTYDEETWGIVGRAYQIDVEIFGYAETSMTES